MELTVFPCLFILFYFILFYSYIAISLPLIFILVFIVSQGNLGCLLTLTKTCALKEGKQNIFGRKMRSTWLHKNKTVNKLSKMENTEKDRKGAGEFFWRVFVKRKRTRVQWSFEGFEDSLKPSNWSADC